MRLLLGLAALSLVLTGCVTAPDSPIEPAGLQEVDGAAAMEAVRALMADVPCEAEVGAGTSENILQLARFEFPDSTIGEFDVRGDLALVARYQLGGLEVVSLTDPANPVLVGSLPLEETRGLDVKWLPKGDGAVIGDFGRIHVVDLSDPAQPVLRSVFSYENESLSGQAHMLTVAAIDGEEWVFVASQTTGMPAYVLKREGWNLTFQGTYGLPLVQSLVLGNHDITIVEDELFGGKPIMYVADGLAGWSAADLTDPAKPQRIGGSLSPEPGLGYTHTVRVAFMDGKRIVATMSEVGHNTLKIYDATDLAKPVLLARWQADATRGTIPQHNIQLVNGWLYMAHYTEGVYAFNLTEVAQGPPLLGSLSLQPAARWAVEEPDTPSALGFANVWDVVLKDGILYASDMKAGLYSIGFGCLAPGDSAQTATL